jgi:hypothetical protein
VTFFDPLERMDDAARNDWEVRQHLYAQRRLAELDEVDTKAKVRKMLAEVAPGPKVCGHISGKDEGRKRCGAPGARMIALTGSWTCREHDPLGDEWTNCTVCGSREVVLCDTRDGPWACSAGVKGHGWPHRLMTLEGE